MTATTTDRPAALDLRALERNLLAEGLRSLADAPRGVTIPVHYPCDTETNGNYEDDRGRRHDVVMVQIGVFPSPDLRLFVHWKHSSIAAEITPEQCLGLAALLTRAAAEAMTR